MEDDLVIAENISLLLRDEKYSVDVVNSIDDATELIAGTDFDCLIFDRRMGDGDGIDLVSKLRQEKNTVPILFLSSYGQKNDIIQGLNIGADDYLIKPFDSNELLARIRALTRRGVGSTILPIIKIADLTINTNTHEVKRNNKSIALSPREYSIIEYLAVHKGQAVERMELLTHAWDDSVDLFSNTLDVHIAYLRKKIDSSHQQKLITTVRGKGYMLCEK